MSRDHSRLLEATTSSFNSFGNTTVSDFDPEGEAIASTRKLDDSYRLPEFQTSVKRQLQQQQQQPVEEPDYAIDTSALERAFPNFSPVHTSEEEEEDDLSIEVGRGANKPARRLDDSRNSMMSFENSVRSSSPAVRLDHITSNTPLKSAVRGTTRRAVSENLRKDAQLRRANLAQKEALDQQYSKTSRKDQRRTLSEMHARVRDTYDGSFIADERPAEIPVNARPTRFTRNDLSNQIADAVERASQEAYAKEVRQAKLAASGRSQNGNGTYTSNMLADTLTHQSFLLPDLPNLSELVSGVYEDGTPVYSRQKTRPTRFVSANAGDTTWTRDHLPLDAVPIPEDEKALFVSLRLLQDKVAELEMAKAEAERKIEEMRQENASLKTDRSRHRDKNERMRHHDAGEDRPRRDGSRIENENKKLESSNLALQNRVDILERKSEVQEAALKRLTRERDMAVSQLGIAYLDSQELKEENETLKQENLELKDQLSRFLSLPRKKREDTMRSERTAVSSDPDAEDSQSYTQRSADMSRTTGDVTSKSARSRSKSKQDESRAKILSQVDKEISRLEKERAEEALFSIDLPRAARMSALKAEDTGSRSKKDTVSRKQSSSGKRRTKRVIVEEVDATSSEQDLTLLSFVDEREIAQLRKTLEEERLARKQRQTVSLKDRITNDTLNTTRQSNSKVAVPRKSSLKETKYVPPRPASVAGDLTANTKASANEEDNSLSVPIERPRRHSDHAVLSSQKKRRQNINDMTSAFILPDITLRFADLAVENQTKLSESAQKALDAVSKHDGKNCTVCKRCIPDEGECDHSHEIVKVPKPVPVSDRMPELSADNEEHTMRPSQPPAVALATVIKALEDELSHLKMQLAAYQAAYNKLDASLNKRKRKSLQEKLEKLLKEVDMKYDQIYALYDVLEGQKQAGHEMTEQEMELTLQSVGIDVSAAKIADVTATTDKSSNKNLDTDYDEDEDEDLPWEGIESTVEITGRI
ncbi:hypothetical protein ASPZODRAFT_686138 [Penicilliopsis zonata CBS 506.65]|uniref:Cep57 centrosome microtubule-binding domain-containing protein n=1 Tax=Penicilliopsis zonata CBS 506.65 TaxID=1073090 RepID=A0A1L9SBM4_9EURO|nr:hypothetical protein ASPZODRAFT_686138 [Penicilliopsis zonata CBS 506.65]OJJ44529.1 hypothetical protein ASPZODRAFT_686138 [Penicilliopsis zonata CBS 506.65]